MKLYLLSRTDRTSYDEYDSFVVAAESEGRALEFYPRGHKSTEDEDYWHWYGGLTTKEYVKIECIGESNSSEEKVIIASFRAG